MREVPAARLPARVVSQYHALTYNEFVPEAWYAAGTANDLAKVADDAERLIRSAKVGAGWDDGVQATNAEEAERFPCNWRHKGFAPFHQPESAYALTNPSQASLLAPFVRRLAAQMRAWASRQSKRVLSALRASPYPLAKGKGAPFFVPGSDRVGAIALAALGHGARTVRELGERAAETGCPAAIWIATNTRIQAARSQRAVWLIDKQGGPYDSGLTALLPKVRKVQGFPFQCNLPLAPLGSLCFSALRQFTQVGGVSTIGLPSIETMLATTRGSPKSRLVATDFSAYDDSIGRELIQLVLEQAILPLIWTLQKAGAYTAAEAALAADSCIESNSMELLLPPLSEGPGAMLYNREGGIVSGIRLTSVIGTLISQAICGLVSVEAGVRARCLNFSDDVLFVCASDGDAERLKDVAPGVGERLGVVTKIAPDATFLQRDAVTGHAYLARMLQSTMQKEANREPRHALVAALGMAARRSLLSPGDASLYDGWLASVPSRSLQLAAAMSHADLYELARAAVPAVLATRHGASANDSLDELLGAIEDLEAGGAWSASTGPMNGRTLKSAIESAIDSKQQGKSDLPRYLPFSEIQTTAAGMGRIAATAYLREHGFWRH